MNASSKRVASQTRGAKQHAGNNVLPITRLLPQMLTPTRGEKQLRQTRGAKQYSGGGVSALYAEGPTVTPLRHRAAAPHRLPPRLRQRRR